MKTRLLQNRKDFARWASFSHILVWGGCVLGVIPYAYFALHGLDFDGKVPVPLRANPHLSVFAVALLATALLFVIVSQSIIKSWSPLLATAAVVGIVVGIGALLGSVGPGRGSLAIRDRPQLPFKSTPNPEFALPILFRNGDFHISSAEAFRLLENFEILKGCGQRRIYVRGFASSRSYHPIPGGNSNHLNKELANARARAVQDLLREKAHIQAILAPPWESYDKMKADRRIVDLDEKDKLVPAREAMNRRAEIFWEVGTCKQVYANEVKPDNVSLPTPLTPLNK